jgi:hypothetical protein
VSGVLHQVLVRLFETQPELVLELLASQVRLPDAPVRVSSSDLTELSVAERHADVVLEIGNDSTHVAIIVEVQSSVDGDKRYSWPQYVAGLHARLRCPVFLAVITLDEEVAAWARRRIGLGPGSAIQPIVIGPREVPRTFDFESAAARPELAWLSVLAHPDASDTPAMAISAMEALDNLPFELARVLADILFASVPEWVRVALEDPMEFENYEYQSDFAKRYVAQGLEQGKREALRHVLTVLLAHRGIHIDGQRRAEIEEAEDVALLERWVLRAATAVSLDDVFG